MTAPQTSRPTPPNVQLAATLTRVLAALIILNGALSLLGQKDATVVMQNGEEVESSFSGVSTVFSLVIPVGIAVILLFLAQKFLTGNNTARIVTYVLTGLFLACNICGSTASFLTDAELRGVPTWYTIWQWIGMFGTLGLSIAVIVLLSMPAANAYFAPAPLAPPSAAFPTPTQPQGTTPESATHTDSDAASGESPNTDDQSRSKDSSSEEPDEGGSEPRRSE